VDSDEKNEENRILYNQGHHQLLLEGLKNSTLAITYWLEANTEAPLSTHDLNRMSVSNS